MNLGFFKCIFIRLAVAFCGNFLKKVIWAERLPNATTQLSVINALVAMIRNKPKLQELLP